MVVRAGGTAHSEIFTMATFVIRYLLAAGVATGALYAAKPLPTTVADKGTVSVSPAYSQERALKRKVAIARFTNETTYGRSFLVDKDANPIGKQALDILSKKLLDTGKFILLERSDLEKVNA